MAASRNTSSGRMLWRSLVLAGLFLCAPAFAAEETALRLPSGAELVSQRYAAAGNTLAVWLTGQHGRVEEEHAAAAHLAARGVETWMTDFFAPYFSPLLPSGWGQVPEADLAAWLEALRRDHPDRRIVLVATGRGASLALRAAAAWRERFGKPGGEAVVGALLLFPLLYQELAPGAEPEYDPVVGRGPLNLVLLQPKSSAGYWWRDRLKGALEAAGSRVELSVLPGLRDGFYRRGDINAQEIAAARRLGEIVLDGLKPLIDTPPTKGQP